MQPWLHFPTNCEINDDRQRWRLNQAFGEATISVNGVGDSISDVITLGDLKTQRTQSQLFQWCEETGESQRKTTWVADHSLPEAIVDSECSQLILSADKSSEGAELDTGGNHQPIAGETAFRIWAETMAASVQTGNSGEILTPVASQLANLRCLTKQPLWLLVLWVCSVR